MTRTHPRKQHWTASLPSSIPFVMACCVLQPVLGEACIDKQIYKTAFFVAPKLIAIRQCSVRLMIVNLAS